MADPRHPDHPIDARFLARSSTRSFTGAPMSDDDLFAMLEAARWAPSSSNVQPWRFIYAKRDTPQWHPVFDSLMPSNQRWADKAAALVVFLSDLHMKRGTETVVSPWHAFDTGAAWMSFALQAHDMGYATHGMGGFFNDRARITLHVPDDYSIDMVAAVGRPGPADALPDDLKARESPTDRRPLADSMIHGSFAHDPAPIDG